MRIVALGDTHGRDHWKQIVKDNPDADKFVFIGDYFDSWGLTFETQMQNFKDIIDFKKANLDRVVLLIGNHDFHYMPVAQESYSGYQVEHALEIGAILEWAMYYGLMQMAFESDDFLYTHAGVTKTWVSKWVNGDWPTISDFINNLWLVSPEAFRFCGFDNTGDNVTQSPIWVRPKSLLVDHIDGYDQVVGHTTFHSINPLGDGGVAIYPIDCLATRMSSEYLEINDGLVKIKKL